LSSPRLSLLQAVNPLLRPKPVTPSRGARGHGRGAPSTLPSPPSLVYRSSQMQQSTAVDLAQHVGLASNSFTARRGLGLGSPPRGASRQTKVRDRLHYFMRAKRGLVQLARRVYCIPYGQEGQQQGRKKQGLLLSIPFLALRVRRSKESLFALFYMGPASMFLGS
jgi:hypothetical protein